MIGHLGARASALLDGQLPPDEAERAWQHVHACHACRDLVEREAWVKRRLARLGDAAAAPEDLKGQLKSPLPPPVEVFATPVAAAGRRHPLGMAALGGGAVGAAVLGVLALGTAPADAPTIPRPTPSPQPVVRPATPTVTVTSPARPSRAARPGQGPVARSAPTGRPAQVWSWPGGG